MPNAMRPSALVVLAAVLFAALCAPPAASPQEDMRVVAPDALLPRSRPPAAFAHDDHNEKAKLEDCVVCHHGKDKLGNLDPEDMTAGTPCVECHAAGETTGTPLKRAYHQQCIACHKAEDKGPTHCAGCHHDRAKVKGG
jgi:hypothetical protein